MISNTPNSREDGVMALSLSELNHLIRRTLAQGLPNTYWVRAETGDVRVNGASGHCYLEFVEKDPNTGQMLAKVKGSIWNRNFVKLRAYFEAATGQRFVSGLKVLVRVSVEFHEVYGLSLNVVGIDPTYTLGDLARRRQEILRRLQQEGVMNLNKQLPLPRLPRRVAIVTSPTAAGYEDFLHQLQANRGGYPFYTCLFPALMQGDRTESSVIAALEQVYQHQHLFDVVVIIRGGGATTDLNSFDSYLLAANVAQFPLPVITGIGHERDDTVVDLVAHTRQKTPTAVAEFLIGCMDLEAANLDGLQEGFVRAVSERLSREKNLLQLLATGLPARVANRIERQRSAINTVAGRLPALTAGLLLRQGGELDRSVLRLRAGWEARLGEQRRFLQLTEQFVKMASPDYILRRGYSLTLREGRIVKQAADLRPGDRLTTRFADGSVQSVVAQKEQ